ncbi:MAG: hypothetical protein II750_06125 [Bacteroidaceae bacterium]|nr:hypothetical protein [Bacteroidaceae bacterium]
MKRFMISMLALLLTGGIATAQTLSVADVEALPGETVTVAVDLNGGKDGTYTAFQFKTATTAAGITVVDCAPSAEWKKATGVAADINTESYTNFASSEAIVSGNTKGLVTVDFKVDASVALGIYEVTIKDGYFGYGTIDDSRRDNLADVTFKVNVVAAHTVVLDETSTVAPVAATGVNVTVNRTIKADELSTIVLPFAMTGAQVKAAFGDDVELYDFAGYETEENTDEDIIGISIKFNTLDANAGMEANHPYVIKVKADVTSFTADNVDIDPEDDPTVATVKRNKKQWSEFIGTYVANTTLEATNIFLSENKFWYSTGKTKMKAFRAYFDFYDVITEIEDEYGAIKVRLDFDGDATAIDTIAAGKSAVEGTFDMSGRKIEKAQRGLNIVDGKKVYVNE